jgi:hypothetical protein
MGMRRRQRLIPSPQPRQALVEFSQSRSLLIRQLRINLIPWLNRELLLQTRSALTAES